MHWHLSHAATRALVPIIGHFNSQVLVRLVLTFVLCGAIGLERSNHERASGLRTHILVGLGSCLITMAGAYGFAGIWADRNPLVLATYVVSGIGFLGAGAILRHGTSVRGLTTAATLWSSAGVGIAVAAGLGGMAVAAVLLILFTLVPLKRWEMWLRAKRDAGDLAIHLSSEGEGVGKTLTALAKMGVHVHRAIVTPGLGDTAVLRVDLVKALRAAEVAPLVKRISALKYVTKVDTTNLNLETGENEDDDADAVDVVELDEPDAPELRDGVGSSTEQEPGPRSIGVGPHNEGED